MFAKREHLLEAKCSYYENLLAEHKKVFEWFLRNPMVHPENVRSVFEGLVNEMEDE